MGNRKSDMLGIDDRGETCGFNIDGVDGTVDAPLGPERLWEGSGLKIGDEIIRGDELPTPAGWG
jgi:hypothetical protein